ncbi:50S ribosomal protein L25 [Candidatus Hodgkinia cicadicola]|uniref:50S ribosomal protein L25 n=1 Tax=Candidatus Hodgkinia cicadicola TaxID=573658 RepID=A0ABX4MG09_9HYPH|nr:50S ribosomal protein L25 [Candidatus Hodgkinia cicadicola]PIM96934.1 50S ribosomal protein L25 [Candidatus Hodgkinia cicadicola]
MKQNMNCFKLITRDKTGSTPCCKTKRNNFIPGTIKTTTNHIIPILVGNGIMKKLTYKQRLVVVVNKIIMNVILKHYQICIKTRQIQNVEYYQTFYKLSKTLIPIIFVNEDRINKSSTKLLKITSKLIVVSNTDLIPNYIKIMSSDFLTGNKVMFNKLNYRHLITTSNMTMISTVK